MKSPWILEHVYGTPDFLDCVNHEVTDCVEEYCTTEKEVYEYIEKINNTNPTDKHGRKKEFYVCWK